MVTTFNMGLKPVVSVELAVPLSDCSGACSAPDSSQKIECYKLDH